MTQEQSRDTERVGQSSEGVPLQTFARSYAQILAGEEPWLPLSEFIHQFFGYYKHLRSELVHDPIQVPYSPSLEQFQWAVFCAAACEYLCTTYEIPCPTWALEPRYSLMTPWYYAIGGDQPDVQEELRQTTPEAFSKRNIYSGDRTFRNKYEYRGRQGRTKPV